MKCKFEVNIFLISALVMVCPLLAGAIKDGGVEVRPNNTAINARDRAADSLTPMDQGTLMPDIDTTAGIRKDIMAHKGMSVDAQNVKIITQYGAVTLRGPVKTEAEKKFIGKSARRRVNPENVDNQLEVVETSRKN